ncbi:Glycosyltransferase family 61 protein, partial [Perilla frutescens var. hirtella]
ARDRICHIHIYDEHTIWSLILQKSGSENSFNVRFQFDKKVLEKPRITVLTWDRARSHVNFGLQKDVT